MAEKIGYHPTWHIKDSPIFINRGYNTSDSGVIESNITFHPHWHDFHELIFLHSDSGIHHINTTQTPCAKGQVYLVFPGDTHWFNPAEPEVELTNILFFPWRIRRELQLLQELRGFHHRLLSEQKEEKETGLQCVVEGRGYGSIRQLLDEMLYESNRKHPGYRSILRAYMIQLFTLLSREGEKKTESTPAERIDHLVSTLENTFYEPWEMERMTELTGMSVSSLNRHCKARTGYPPAEYLNRLRIKKAEELVSHTRLTFTQIAYQTGFSDSNYFARQFKRVTGKTASRYRLETQ